MVVVVMARWRSMYRYTMVVVDWWWPGEGALTASGFKDDDETS
jgi:hypothetical protein